MIIGPGFVDIGLPEETSFSSSSKRFSASAARADKALNMEKKIPDKNRQNENSIFERPHQKTFKFKQKGKNIDSVLRNHAVTQKK